MNQIQATTWLHNRRTLQTIGHWYDGKLEKTNDIFPNIKYGLNGLKLDALIFKVKVL